MATVILETGAGLANANGYVDVAFVDTYHADRENSTWETPTNTNPPSKEASIIIATQSIDAMFRGRWKGERKLRTQRLYWPRLDVEDDDGFFLDSSILPRELQEATAEFALEVRTGTSLIPNQTTPGAIALERVRVDVIDIETRYTAGAEQQQLFTLAQSMLGRLLREGSILERA